MEYIKISRYRHAWIGYVVSVSGKLEIFFRLFYFVFYKNIKLKTYYFKDTTWIVRKELTLSGSNIMSTMTISVLFYPVKTIQQVVTSRRSSIVPIIVDDEPKIKRNSLPWMQQAVSHEISYIFGIICRKRFFLIFFLKELPSFSRSFY